METNKIYNYEKCCKPRRFMNSFKGNELSGAQDENATRKVRYKHYEELSDDVLAVRSILKAHKEVEESSKMKLLKATPAITAGLTGLAIGLTQPGRLSAKVASGVGFLVALGAVNKVFDGFRKSYAKDLENDTQKNTNKFILKLVGLTLGAIGIGALVKNGKAGEFLSKETQKLTQEINTSKLAKFNSDKIQPFIEKHPKLNCVAGLVLPLGAILGGSYAEAKTAQSLSKDIKNKANDNFIKAKEIQKVARAEFDAIEAQEI